MLRRELMWLLSLCSFILGVFFLINLEMGITGAITGIPVSSKGYVIGFFFVFLSCILFLIGMSGLERKIRLTSAINNDKGLIDLA